MLGPVKRRIGRIDKLMPPFSTMVSRHPHRNRHPRQALFGQLLPCLAGHPLKQPSRDLRQLPIQGPRQEYDKLFTPIANRRIPRSQTLLQQLPEQAQHLIARKVAVTVVVLLEVIHIEHHQAQLSIAITAMLATLQQPGQQFIKPVAVVESGEGVNAGVLGELLLTLVGDTQGIVVLADALGKQLKQVARHRSRTADQLPQQFALDGQHPTRSFRDHVGTGHSTIQHRQLPDTLAALDPGNERPLIVGQLDAQLTVQQDEEEVIMLIRRQQHLAIREMSHRCALQQPAERIGALAAKKLQLHQFYPENFLWHGYLLSSLITKQYSQTIPYAQCHIASPERAGVPAAIIPAMNRDKSHWRRRGEQALTRLQIRLSRADALLELSLLGLFSGLAAGAVSILFRLALEFIQAGYLDGPPGSFETLTGAGRFWLPVAGGLAIGLLLHFTREEFRMVGVAHVMLRLQYYQGRMPLGNTVVQLIGGLLALASGHSVGREGPGVHLGVAASNLPAQALRLPNNSLRVLAACGTAAAIAASFNTPLAGVVFAMEVLMFQYTVAGFAPVLLATVIATALSRLVFGDDLAFSVPEFAMGSLAELPLVLLMGLLCGGLAGFFIHLLRATSQLATPLPFWFRGLLAGLLVGSVGLFVPEVMGIGYDTVNRLIAGEMALWLVLSIIALKLLASTTAVGLGIPGGLIGPALVVGAATGGAFAWLADYLGLMGQGSTVLFVLLGMAAMMAGTLQAPLAALVAILELSGNPAIIFPGLLTVITATLVSGHIYGKESMYLAMLRAIGRDYRNDPIAESLRKLGVGAVMERSFITLPQLVTVDELSQALKEAPRWILLRDRKESPQLLAAVDVAIAIRERESDGPVDLMDLPAKRLQATAIDFQATLQDAREELTRSGAEALYVTRLTVPGIPRVYGVLTLEDIENSYRF